MNIPLTIIPLTIMKLISCHRIDKSVSKKYSGIFFESNRKYLKPN